ncbi:kinase-like protein [Rhizophagus irregularis]|nr:kinase-like protein [Rhizophagus irregularis]
MEIVNTNDENSFDPTPRLKSSPIQIKFISFNVNDENCVYCGEKYIKALLSYQYYCQKCLSRYINDITENDIYLDVHYTMDLECSEHEISRTKIPQSIQECCGNCVRILCYKQTNGYISELGLDENDLTLYNKVIESEKNCKLCGKSIYQGIYEWYISVKLCSDCYLISSGLIESTLVKKKISILYLPWWHNNCRCNVCNSELTFTSDCQKYCANCFIFYVGCRYCLTTNILFGPTDQSQCKKCKRISPINSGIDDFLFNNNLVTFDNLDYLKLTKFENTIVKHINKYFVPWRILNSIFREQKQAKQNQWIPYSQFKDVREITRGGYGIIYIATWLNKNNKNKTVILKRFENSKNIGKYFLNELKSCDHCFKDKGCHIIETYGFTKDPELEDYILVMEYASGGDLHKHLQKDFASITWNKEKLRILHQISIGLKTIHNKKFIHRDFHSGNILFDPKGNRVFNDDWEIGDLGLSQAVNSKSSNNEVYGVIPYIAPEIFRGSIFSKEADIYSFGMIMWELTTGCKPFDNVKHDHHLIYKILDGERPKITEDTPECYANLMKSCWDADPKKRPSIKDIRLTFGRWTFKKVNEEEFEQAEAKRMKLIGSKMIGPEFAEKRHPGAIYISRPLSALISKCSTIYSSSTISFDKQDSNYISEELELDIDIESLSSQNSSSTIQNLDSSYISAELELDINTERSQNLSSTIQNFSTSLEKRRNVEFLNVEPHDNSGKYSFGSMLNINVID